MTALRLRRSARIILLDPAQRVLLFRFDIPGRDPFWCTPGGECDAGESFEQAARRELLEETGIAADCGAQIARTTPQFTTPEGEPVQADERYFLVRAGHDAVCIDGHTDLERRVMTRYRWFDPGELAAWPETVFPENLAAIIAAHQDA
ncbi:NUDIX hydrolase [Qipengyuania nanhaisediminis]|uniref:NUDIX hydrolase n=1 Tax=Qipengyuania nanhaisediminis TaxID=604088 RepID=UPI0038B265BC